MRRVGGGFPTRLSIGSSSNMPDVSSTHPALVECSTTINSTGSGGSLLSVPQGIGSSSLSCTLPTATNPLTKVTSQLVSSFGGIHQSELKDMHLGKL